MSKKNAIIFSQSLGVYQTLGGIIGLSINLYLPIFNFQWNVFFLLYAMINIGLFSFSIYAGLKCFKATPRGLSLTFYNQLLQLISFTAFGFAYLYNTGLGLFVGIDITSGASLAYQLKALSFYLGKSDPEKISFLINIVPLAIAFLVSPIMKELNKPTS